MWLVFLNQIFVSSKLLLLSKWWVKVNCSRYDIDTTNFFSNSNPTLEIATRITSVGTKETLHKQPSNAPTKSLTFFYEEKGEREKERIKNESTAKEQRLNPNAQIQCLIWHYGITATLSNSLLNVHNQKYRYFFSFCCCCFSSTYDVGKNHLARLIATRFIRWLLMWRHCYQLRCSHLYVQYG